jgi:S1-C subfamily serine protease
MFLRIVLVFYFTTLFFSVAEATEIPSLGVNVESVTLQTAQQKKLPVPTGSLILSIQQNSPAAKAGLKVG